ncbi:MAG: hypothetical protein QM758_04980 [Armatimonas sp.]
MDYIFKRGRQLLSVTANDYAHALTLARHDMAQNEAEPVGIYSSSENYAYVFSQDDPGVALSRIRRVCNLVKSHTFARIELVEM